MGEYCGQEVDIGEGAEVRWKFGPNAVLEAVGRSSIRGMLRAIRSNIDEESNPRPVVPLGHGDPSAFPCFRTPVVAEDAVAEALRSGQFNSYPSNVGYPPARRAVAEYLNQDLPYKLSPDDVYLTLGCSQAIEAVMAALARPHANVLLPRPGFPLYEAQCAFNGIQARHFNLLPDRNWEVDLDAVEALADENTAAMVIINPGNPCGNVFSYRHLAKIAETARRLGILVIADEVYGHLTFGSNPFVPMGAFGSVAPVLTLGSISKRWVVPGWRLGWLVVTDPNGVLMKSKILDSIQGFLNISSDPPTFVQAALPQILRDTTDDYFMKTTQILQQSADICYTKLQKIECLTCTHRPEGSMFAMVKLNLSLLDNIYDDLDLCFKLAKEEKVIILPGTAVGLKNWLRITFAIEPASLLDGLDRLKSFCERHKKLD